MIDNVFASVAVRDLVATIKWYEALLGHPADSTPMPTIAEWKFDGGGWLQVYQQPERASAGSFTFAVSDIESEIRRVAALGLDTSQQAAGAMVKTLMITDPDGNHIAFAEAIDRTMARSRSAWSIQ